VIVWGGFHIACGIHPPILGLITEIPDESRSGVVGKSCGGRKYMYSHTPEIPREPRSEEYKIFGITV
jgi:hypothetical protein